MNTEEVIQGYPEDIRPKVERLRALILETAASLDEIGPLTETLKWGEPAYLTEKTKSGSTIRFAWKASAPSQYALYFNCQTTLVDTFRTLFPELQFEGNRAMVFNVEEPLPEDAVATCIELALTYHSRKRRRRRTG